MAKEIERLEESYRLLDFLNFGKISSILMDQICTLLMELEDWDLGKICTQWVIMRPFFCKNRAEDYYQIDFGYPPDNQRHNIGGVGKFHAPARKEALIRAIETGQIIQVNDAYRDPLVEYMRPHVHNKRILSIAVIPIKYCNEIIRLVILDKVLREESWEYFDDPANSEELQSLAGFSESDMAKIWKMRSYIEKRGLEVAVKGAGLADDFSTTGGRISQVSHIVLNKLIQSIALLSKAVKAIPEEKEVQRNLGNVALNDLKTLENDIKILMRLIHHTCRTNKQPENISANELQDMLGNDYFQYEIPGLAAGQTAYADRQVLCDTLAELARYIEANRKPGKGVIVEFSADQWSLRINIRSGAFMAFKESLDLRIALIRDIITGTLEGSFEIKDDLCVIGLPLSRI